MPLVPFIGLQKLFLFYVWSAHFSSPFGTITQRVPFANGMKSAQQPSPDSVPVPILGVGEQWVSMVFLKSLTTAFVRCIFFVSTADGGLI